MNKHFIIDRAMTLRFEAKRLPNTASVAHAWIYRAMAYAEKTKDTELIECLQKIWRI